MRRDLEGRVETLALYSKSSEALEEFEVTASAFSRKLSGPCVAAGERSAVYCINAAEG